LAIDLLQQVRNPHNPQRADGGEIDDELTIAGVPQRIASKRATSEFSSNQVC